MSNREREGDYRNHDLYIMNADGTEQTLLSDDPGDDEGPVWSPDGAKIAFDSYRDHNDEVYVMDADDSDQTNLSDDPHSSDWGPAWSPDGAKVAFASNRDDNSEVYTVDAGGGETPTNLTKNPGDDEGPVWSPDGTKIAFERNRDIFVMNADGSDQTNLTDDWEGNTNPAWSPDGARIAFESHHDNAYGEIYAMDADDGDNKDRLTDNAASDSGPAFSPDGTRIAFESERDGASQVYVMNADSSGQISLSDDPETEEWGPVWSPDGAKLAFVRRDSGHRQIYTMDADGDNETPLTYSADNNDEPRWQPIAGTAPEATTEPTAPTTPTTPPSTPSEPSESVDWRNTRYTTDCGGVAPESFTVDVSNGEGYGPPDSTYESYDVRVETVATGDLTGDGNPEAAVLLYCAPQPSNFFSQEVQVFTDGAQLLAQLPELSPLPDGLDLTPLFDSDEFLIRSGQLVTGVDYYSATDSHASGPSIHRVLTWQWDGSRFTAEPEPDQYQPEQSQPVGAETVATVPGYQPWTDTGLDLAAGSSVTITADGTIKIAGSDPGKTPDGDQNCIPSELTDDWAAGFIAPDLHCWALIARIGDAAPFEVGSSGSFSVPSAGRLYLGLNEGSADFGDNSGSWTADITVSDSY